MHAIILAAGMGNRLGLEFPKSLLKIGGESLLSRHFVELAKHRVKNLAICVGYRSDLLREAASHSGLVIECIENRDFNRGSVVSLWTVRDVLTSGAQILLMDADVLCAPRILETLIASPHANCFLLDRDFIPGDEPVKLCVREGRLVEFRKRPEPSIPFDYCGESVGFFKFSPTTAAELARRCETYIVAGRLDEPYEEAIRDLLIAPHPQLDFEDVSG
ncbi:MAG: NTP transferase domain-containing protein, partial [Gammaproteobacteria bacterium]